MTFLILFIACIIIISFVTVATRQSAALLSNDEAVKATVLSITKRWTYFTVLFEAEGGDRITLDIYGQLLLAVGDIGMLTYHRTVFKSFERVDNIASTSK
ncbi:MAG: hypothetical protein CVV64_22650 [Candidatus Wallbacteria bacterium HGW-Wallbacteria-1]|jgi:hypothetical protein|uniref:Uncharacterized protein n=1 Tax=Candidatus Wallbacteria bacterium HGW-Wallbacteria-1 TaxID=2013854 RepID=A0A2N1PFM7_9BACT|nr:MAG: hypothetical protein CVV64_22650 [Candidatus Wallbacteria bacterium HGW-Wallbacteria-1]